MSIVELVFITVIIELLEVYLQYGSTLKESLTRLFNYYQKSPFVFFASNIGYLWLLFIAVLYSKLNFAIILGIMLKTFDIFTKTSLMQKVFLKPSSNNIDEISMLLDTKVPIWIYLIGLMTYPYIVYISLS